MTTRPRDDDQAAVMQEVGPVFPILAAEMVEHGFFEYARSRARDPVGHAEYTDCTKANMLYDRIAAVGRDLVDAAEEDDFHWRISANRRATEIYRDPHLAYRIKRIKRNRGDLTTSVNTRRQRIIKSFSRLIPIGQMVLPFLGLTNQMGYANPLWITVAFDLDEIEESVSRIYIGLERRKSFLWRIPVPEAAPNVIATLSGQLAERIMDMRQLRSA